MPFLNLDFVGPLALRFLTALLVFGAFWLAGTLLRSVIVKVGTARGVDRYLSRLLGKIVRVTLMIVGGISALGTVGIDVTALVAGLGLTGFALGFALKDIVSNVLAGVLIIIYKPFRHGDSIKVSSFSAVVSNIDLRYTTLTAEGEQIFVPNSLLFTNAITVNQLVDTSTAPTDSVPNNPPDVDSTTTPPSS